MKATFTGAGPTVTQSIPVTDPGSHWQTQAWQIYASGTLGASGTIDIQVSPDMRELPDAQSRWFDLLAAPITTVPETQWLQARFRKVRFNFTGGDATTAVTVEIV